MIANPFAEAGFDDDWAYSHVALRFVETGGIHYNGWGSPTLLFQVLWAAPWIRLFGFSFDILRLATIPFSLGFVSLIYLLGRKIGLTCALASFAALGVGTSPLFLPLAASFMTEPYACFFSTLCVYAAIESAEASRTRAASAWLWVTALSGIVGGANRQTVWMAPIVLIPYIFWVKRADRNFTWNAAIAYGACIASIVFVAMNFGPPYEPLEMGKRELLWYALRNLPKALGYIASALLCCALVSLPSLLAPARLWKRLGEKRLLLTGIGCTCIFALLIFFGPRAVVPFLGNILTSHGILFPGQDALGLKPKLLPDWLRLSLTWLLMFGIVTSAWLFRLIRPSIPRVPITVFTLFALAYVPCLFPGAVLGITYDRYVLPLFPLLVLFALSLLKHHVAEIPIAGCACMLLFAAYAVAITHDYSAALRSRASVAAILQKRGIQRNRISAGFEYDGWTQLQLTGKIRVRRSGDALDWNLVDKFWIWPYADAMNADYVVENSQSSVELGDGLPAIQYLAWMAPFRRWAVAVPRADLVKRKP